MAAWNTTVAAYSIWECLAPNVLPNGRGMFRKGCGSLSMSPPAMPGRAGDRVPKRPAPARMSMSQDRGLQTFLLENERCFQDCRHVIQKRRHHLLAQAMAIGSEGLCGNPAVCASRRGPSMHLQTDLSNLIRSLSVVELAYLQTPF